MRRARRLGEVVIGLLTALVVAPAARADLPVPFILWVDADLAATPPQLRIHGTSFGTGPPKVRLAGNLLQVTNSSATEIVATLPDWGVGPPPTS
jgi:hypothetical protein